MKTNVKKYTKFGMLKYFLKGSVLFFVCGIACNLVYTLLGSVIPQIIGFSVDSVIGDNPVSAPFYIGWIIKAFGGLDTLKSKIYLLSVTIIVVALIIAIFRFLSENFHSLGNEKLMKRMRNGLFSHIQELPLSWLNKNKTGDIIQRCTSDTATISEFVSQQLISLFEVIILIAVSLAFMFSMNVKLALIAACSIPVVIGYSTFFRSKVAKHFLACDENEGILSTYAQENFTGVRVVKAFGREAYESKKFENQNQVYTNKWMKLCKWLSIYWGAGDFVSALQVMLVIVLGTLLCVDGKLTSGELIAFISYNTMLIYPVRSIGRMISEMSKAGVSLNRIREIMNAEPENYGVDDGSVVKGDVVFDNVSFSYDGDEKVLDGISFSVKEGDTLGIVGATGSGKSTIIRLLNGFYPDYSGEIYIGDKNIRDLPLKVLRRSVGTVLQEPYLYSRTIEENISALKNVDHNSVVRAAKVACIDKNIDAFAKGYGTEVGERGVTLSGGQKQRVAIARTILTKSPIMVFDDSLSAVDSETDASIRANLQQECKNVTTIIIAHRINTVKRADEIIVLKKGKIVERGTNDELLKIKDGIYKQIYDMQLSLPDELKGDFANEN